MKIAIALGTPALNSLLVKRVNWFCRHRSLQRSEQLHTAKMHSMQVSENFQPLCTGHQAHHSFQQEMIFIHFSIPCAVYRKSLPLAETLAFSLSNRCLKTPKIQRLVTRATCIFPVRRSTRWVLTPVELIGQSGIWEIHGSFLTPPSPPGLSLLPVWTCSDSSKTLP